MKCTVHIVVKVTVTVTIVHLPNIDTFVWPARRCGHWQPLRYTIEGEEQREEGRRGRGGCDDGTWSYGRPFMQMESFWSSSYESIGELDAVPI